MANVSKRYKAVRAKVNRDKFYALKDALQLVKENATAKFNEAVDVALNLGIDAKKSDQNVRGSVVLPQGTGKTVRVAVFAQGEKAQQAKDAGADLVGFDDLAAEIKGGKMDFDVVIATPDAMRVVGQLGQVLGPRGLMPNPKVGTVTQDVTLAVKNAKAGQVQYRADKAGIVQCTIGRASFTVEALEENIRALVDAVNKARPAGTKGISCFIVPKYLVNDDGSLGARNDVKVVSIEHKMGIKASPTCVMSFGEDDGAIAYLIGEENRGMSYMFTMMNSARLSVGLEGLALAERAYQDALQYSQERRQGRAPVVPAPEDGGMSYIIDLPDVRRMLLTMRSIIDALRAIIYVNAYALDMASHHPDEDVRQRNQELVELLIPVSKGFGTDMGIEATSLAIQVYGGMGYIEESGVPQHFRDARITAIYEGTNGIQAMDLVGRKLPMRAGGVMDDYLTQISSLVARLDGAGAEFVGIRDRLDESLACVRNTVMWLMEHGIADVRNALAGATPFLRMFGLLVGARYLADSALAAKADIDAGVGDAEYLNARVTVARFYCDNLLPGVLGLESAVTAGFEDLYAIANEAL